MYIILLMSQPRKKIDKYIVHLDKKLGVGSFGTVFIGFHIDTKDKVAVKMLDKKTVEKDKYMKEAFFAEIEILKTLKSSNIVGFLDVMESSNFYYIVQEFCDGGDLRSLINNRGCISEKEAITIIAQVCNGFVQLLKQGIVHRDLKPQNILINQGVVKICDFGFSKKISSQRLKNSTIVGTPLYMSIQILKGEQYTSKCDIWALGFIFYQLIHGVPPWNAASQYQLITFLESTPLKFTKNVSPTTKDFIGKCLAINQKNRISWDQLIRHQIFNGMFAHYVKKEHEFENKFKIIMGQIRYEINSKNIALDKLMAMYGFSGIKDLDFKVFDKVIRTIDPNLTAEEIRYIFEKLDLDGDNTISLAQLHDAMIANNIPVKSHYAMPPKKESQKEKDPEEAADQFKQKTLAKKVCVALVKLQHKLKICKVALEEVFFAYGVNKQGDITIGKFREIMKRLDQTLTDDDIRLAFQMIAGGSSGSVSLREFETYYRRCIEGQVGQTAHQKVNSS